MRTLVSSNTRMFKPRPPEPRAEPTRPAVLPVRRHHPAHVGESDSKCPAHSVSVLALARRQQRDGLQRRRVAVTLDPPLPDGLDVGFDKHDDHRCPRFVDGQRDHYDLPVRVEKREVAVEQDRLVIRPSPIQLQATELATDWFSSTSGTALFPAPTRYRHH
jgi:hypothetical protein